VRSLVDEKHVALRDGNLELLNLDPGDYSLRYGKERHEVTISVAQGEQVAGWVIGEARDLQVQRPMPLQISSVTVAKDVLTIGLGNVTPDTRVHVLASRFIPPFDVFGSLGQTPGLEPMSGLPADLRSLFVSAHVGRRISLRDGAPRPRKKFPGMMLPRPGLLLNPWKLRDTETAAADAQTGTAYDRVPEGKPGSLSPPVPRRPFGSVWQGTI